MHFNKRSAINKNRRHTALARVYFQEISPECAIFKDTTSARVLVYSWDKRRWECECWMYSLVHFCPHFNAAQKLLPIPDPIILQ